MKEKLENYAYSINTEIKFRGNWEKINEVWFYEHKIGLKSSGYLINFSEVEDIRS